MNKSIVKRVLIIYSQMGGGHLSLAKSLQKAFANYYPNRFIVEMADPFPKIYNTVYGMIGRDFQAFWGLNFRLSNQILSTSLNHKLNYSFIKKRLKKIIIRHKPDLIVSNNTLATIEIKKALQELNRQAKIVIQFADPFTVHEMWLFYKEADLYLSPTIETTNTAVKNGIPKEKIKTVGWPIRPEFQENFKSSLLLKKEIGINNKKFIIFVGGSGQGGGKILSICKYLARSNPVRNRCQIIIVTGKNKALFDKLSVFSLKYPDLFRLFGYLENPASLLAASDIVIGKAGPNLLFESISLKKPFLATGWLPGQEDGNLEFIRKESIGWVEKNPKKAVLLIEEILREPKLLIDFQTNLRKLREKHLDAGKNAVQEIAKLADS